MSHKLTMITDYRARCCGTCRHKDNDPEPGMITRCLISEKFESTFAICMKYKPEE